MEILPLATAERNIPRVANGGWLWGFCFFRGRRGDWGIPDGDDAAVVVGTQTYNVRLACIDAPEHNQLYGDRAKWALAEMVSGKTVSITPMGQDKYGRLLGIVYSDGRCINTELVKQGAAWNYQQYSNSTVLANAEQEARQARRGLWASDSPMPPWEWRHRKPEQTAPAPVVTTNNERNEELTHWLNTKSWVRHNRGCRYYHNTKNGRPCRADEGKPCGICGG